MEKVEKVENLGLEQLLIEGKLNYLGIRPFTLESGINVPPWINVAPGNLAKIISVAPFIPYSYTT